jgi:hypothetical protein
MRYRINLPHPINYDSITIYNGNCQKPFVDWRFNLPYEALSQLDDWGYDVGSLPSLADILKIVGSHATLWIDERVSGIVAPMDVEPQQWTYRNRNMAIAPEWFWLWYPDKRSQEILVKEANLFTDNPTALFDEYPSIFKSLVPFQLTCARGTIEQIEAIPITKLASLVRQNCNWTFEWEQR